MAVLLALKDIIVDHEIQSRAEVYPDTLQEYAIMINEGAEFPPVVVFDTDVGYLLADGFHRIEAHRLAGKRKISAEIKEGTRRDALLYSFGANSKHGQRMTRADKRKVVGLLLADPEWSLWSDNEIARQVGVTQPFVSGMRKELRETTGEPAPTVRKAKRQGTEYTIEVGTIATTPKVKKPIDLVPPQILDVTDVVEEIEVVEVEISPNLGNMWRVDDNILYYNTLSKVIKKIGEFNYCFYFGAVKDAIKGLPALFDKCSGITLVIDHGDSIFDAIADIDLPYQKGTLAVADSKPYYLLHYGENEISLEDFSTNSLLILIEEMIKGCSDEGHQILIIDPPRGILPTIHRYQRTCTIVSSNENYIKEEIKALPRWGLDAKLG
jgi:hypothetical protein